MWKSVSREYCALSKFVTSEMKLIFILKYIQKKSKFDYVLYHI